MFLKKKRKKQLLAYTDIIPISCVPCIKRYQSNQLLRACSCGRTRDKTCTGDSTSSPYSLPEDALMGPSKRDGMAHSTLGSTTSATRQTTEKKTLTLTKQKDIATHCDGMHSSLGSIPGTL